MPFGLGLTQNPEISPKPDFFDSTPKDGYVSKCHLPWICVEAKHFFLLFTLMSQL